LGGGLPGSPGCLHSRGGLAQDAQLLVGERELAGAAGECVQEQFAVVADDGGSERVVPPASRC